MSFDSGSRYIPSNGGVVREIVSCTTFYTIQNRHAHEVETTPRKTRVNKRERALSMRFLKDTYMNQQYARGIPHCMSSRGPRL